MSRNVGMTRAQASQYHDYLKRNMDTKQIRLGSLDGDYPLAPYVRDVERDTKYQTLAMLRPSLTYQVGDAEIQYLQDKKKEEYEIKMLQLARSMFDLSRPAEAAYFRERFPRAFELMERNFNDKMEIVRTFARINRTGVQNEEDLRFVAAVREGQIVVPANFTAEGLMQSLDKTMGHNIVPTRGLLNPLRWLTPELNHFGVSSLDTNAPFSNRNVATYGLGIIEYNNQLGYLTRAPISGNEAIPRDQVYEDGGLLRPGTRPTPPAPNAGAQAAGAGAAPVAPPQPNPAAARA